jgi:MoxR-like ATPase
VVRSEEASAMMSAPAIPGETLDSREAGRVVASVLVASAPLTPELVAHANHGLTRLMLGPLTERDFTPSTPEELAPIIPPHLRDALADLIVQIAGQDPLRRRVAQSYLALWRPGHEVRHESASPRDGTTSPMAERLARVVIGELPRHQDVGSIPEERNVYAQQAYRGVDPQVRLAEPVVDPLRARVARVRAEMTDVIAAVDRVVIGKHEVVTRVIGAMAARGHVLLVDAPGVGKTLLCKTIAAALGARFGRVQLTPDLMPMDVTGQTTYDAQAAKFVFRPGPVFTNFLLADEINRATPKTQSALLEVMEERTVTVDGTTHRMADPFQVLATMNPIDHDGTFPLPAAQIDRFMVMLELGYPSPDDEIRVLDTHLAGSHGDAAAAVSPVVSAEAFVEWQRTVPLIHVSPEVKRAAVTYVDALRRTAPSGHSISPRATLAWMRAAQARAILAGREFVTLEDLVDVAPEILRHRLWVSAPEVRDRLRAVMVHAAGTR